MASCVWEISNYKLVLFNKHILQKCTYVLRSRSWPRSSRWFDLCGSHSHLCFCSPESSPTEPHLKEREEKSLLLNISYSLRHAENHIFDYSFKIRELLNSLRLKLKPKSIQQRPYETLRRYCFDYNARRCLQRKCVVFSWWTACYNFCYAAVFSLSVWNTIIYII